MKKKVCIIGDLYQTYLGKNQGGGESQLVYAAKALTELGLRVLIVDYRIEKRILTEDGIEFIPLNINNHISLFDKITKKIFKLYRILSNINADYYFSSIRGYHHLVPLIVSKINNKKFYYWVAADIDLGTFFEQIKYEYKNKQFINNLINIFLTALVFPIIIDQADLVFVQHRNQAEKISNTNVHILNNVTDSINISYNKSNYFIWVGSIDFKKGFHILEGLSKDLNQVKVKIIGKVREKLCIPILNQLTHNSNIEYLGNLDKNGEVLSYIGKACALLNTSYMEGFPITFIEAWSLNTPVISLNVDPGNVIRDNNLGFCALGSYSSFISYIKNFDSRVNLDLKNYYNDNHSPLRFKKEISKYFYYM